MNCVNLKPPIENERRPVQNSFEKGGSLSLGTILSAITWGWRCHHKGPRKKIGWQRWVRFWNVMQVLPATVKLPEFYGTMHHIPSMYYNGILTYIGLILMVNVGCKYTIHGWYGSMGCFSRTKRMSCSLHRCWSNRKMDDDDFLAFRNKDL